MENRTLTWRALTTEDAPALTRAYAAVEAVDHTGEHYSEQDLRDELEDESIDLGRDTLAALAPDGELVAFAWVGGSVEVHDLDRIGVEGAVVPAARGRRLGRRLLEWAEERAASLHTERHPDSPGAVCFDVHERNAGKQALVQAAGYEATRWFHKMTRGLDDPLPDVPPTPPGLTLAPYTADRDEAVRHAHREAFAGHWGATPLGVRSAWRRRGLGGLLLATALESYRTAGYERSVLTVDTGNATGALRLYERAGYTVTDTSVVWTKPLG